MDELAGTCLNFLLQSWRFPLIDYYPILQDWFDDTRLKFMKNKPDKKAMKEEYQIMYKKVLEFTETVGRGASQRSQTEETLSMVDKGKYPKKFAEVS